MGAEGGGGNGILTERDSCQSHGHVKEQVSGLTGAYMARCVETESELKMFMEGLLNRNERFMA